MKLKQACFRMAQQFRVTGLNGICSINFIRNSINFQLVVVIPEIILNPGILFIVPQFDRFFFHLGLHGFN